MPVGFHYFYMVHTSLWLRWMGEYQASPSNLWRSSGLAERGT
jgi:hypothetical protein